MDTAEKKLSVWPYEEALCLAKSDFIQDLAKSLH